MSTSFIFVLMFTLIALVLLGFTIVGNNLNAKDIVFSFTALCAAFLMFFLNTILALKDEVKTESMTVELSIYNMIADIHSLSHKKSSFFVFHREEISKEVNLDKYFKLGSLNEKNMKDENFFSFSIESREELNSAIKDISKFLHIGIIGEMLSKNPDWEIFKNKKTFRGSEKYSFNTSAEYAGKNTFIAKNEFDKILDLTSFKFDENHSMTEGLTLPPDTKVKVKENILFIDNPFVELQFSIDIDHNVSHFPPENTFNIMDGNFSNTSYMSVNLMIESRFKKERFGSREMASYKKWVEHITKDFRTAFEFKTLEK
ncbi:hypothetical protein [Pseudoalteromonas xiamenensis]|uniref:Uncharacterized protein n=1 Tax=Pseudoalteromonas xiamenensis TaxID=882626 RepID=A0A975DF44_9GAMM|nr:hypothetical protein [Pseudoalteromonas xiamenensis]QTH70663.1 hypothetical protein J5O05_12055 [Pseudoalteromonas xiamenensis]